MRDFRPVSGSSVLTTVKTSTLSSNSSQHAIMSAIASRTRRRSIFEESFSMASVNGRMLWYVSQSTFAWGRTMSCSAWS